MTLECKKLTEEFVKNEKMKSDGTIYYFMECYREEYLNQHKDDSFYNDALRNSLLLANLKKLGPNKSFSENNPVKEFGPKVNKLLQRMFGDFLVCVMPRREQIKQVNNDMTQFLDECALPFGFIRQYDLIKRTVAVEKDTTGQANTLQQNYDSLKINKFVNINGKQIILFDDVSTTGGSILAARDLLLKAKAKEVFLVSIAKMFNEYIPE